MIGNITLDRELATLLSDDVQFSNLLKMHMRRLAKRQARRGLVNINSRLIEREVRHAVNVSMEQTNKVLAPFVAVRLTWDLQRAIVFTATLQLNEEFKSLKAQNKGSMTYLQ